jgi:hypothetical protein
MVVNYLSFRGFTLALILNFASRVLALIDKVGADNLGIESQVEKLLRPAVKKFDDAYKKDRGSRYTGKIDVKEKLLNNGTTSLFGMVEIGRKSSEPEIVESAENLTFSLKPFKGVTRKKRKEQITDTENMVQVLEGKCAADVAKLNLGKLVTEIKGLTADIKSFETSRTEENTIKDEKNTEEAKKETIDAYRAVVKFVEVLVMTNGSNEHYKEFVGNLNTIIKEFSGNNPTPSADKPVEPTKPPFNPDDYPNSMEWESGLEPYNVVNGDVLYVFVDREKVYYKILDNEKVSVTPGSVGSESVWEKLS